MTLSVLAVADEVSPVLYKHFDARQWQGIDCIISCGDLPPYYLDFLGTQLGAPVFYVRGNHDGEYAHDAYAVGEDLHCNTVEYRGVRMVGFEGCRRYNHGRPQYTEREMAALVRRQRLKAVRRGAPQLIVTHAPPAGIQDGADVCHKGFKCFNRLIEAWKPSFLLHGHMHSYERKPTVTVVGSTTVINVYPYCRFELPQSVPELQTARTREITVAGVAVTEQPRVVT